MKNNRRMREFIKVSTGGSPREMGFDIGRATADLIREVLAGVPDLYRKETGHDIAFLRRFAMRQYLPAARRGCPERVQELLGLAEGAGLPFSDILPFSAEEEMLDLWGHWDRCSSASVSMQSGILLLHNEDYVTFYRGRLVLIEAFPDHAPAFLSLAYPGTLAGSACGINSAGLAMSNNSLRFLPRRRGITKNFLLRDALSARSLSEVTRRLTADGLACSQSVNVVSARENRAIFTEATSGGQAVVEMGKAGILAHTNHVLSPGIDNRREYPTMNSRLRLAGLEHLLGCRRSWLSMDNLKKTLSSKTHYLLRRGHRSEDPETLASIIMDPRRGLMFVAARATADAKYVRHRLPQD